MPQRFLQSPPRNYESDHQRSNDSDSPRRDAILDAVDCGVAARARAAADAGVDAGAVGRPAGRARADAEAGADAGAVGRPAGRARAAVEAGTAAEAGAAAEVANILTHDLPQKQSWSGKRKRGMISCEEERGKNIPRDHAACNWNPRTNEEWNYQQQQPNVFFSHPSVVPQPSSLTRQQQGHAVQQHSGISCRQLLHKLSHVVPQEFQVVVQQVLGFCLQTENIIGNQQHRIRETEAKFGEMRANVTAADAKAIAAEARLGQIRTVAIAKIKESKPALDDAVKRATAAEEKLTAAENRATSAEEKLAAAENRATSAEEKLAAAENRATAAEEK